MSPRLIAITKEALVEDGPRTLWQAIERVMDYVSLTEIPLDHAVTISRCWGDGHNLVQTLDGNETCLLHVEYAP